MDKLLSIGRILEISEATRNADWIYNGRCADIQKLPAAQRLAARSLLIFAHKYPATACKILDASASIQGYRFLGSGVEYSSYLRESDGRVAKMNRASVNRSPEELDELRHQILTQHSLLRGYLGEIVLSSDVYVAEHILGGGHQVLQIEQPYVDTAANPLPFTSQHPDVNKEDIHQIIADVTGADVALGEFCEASRKVFSEKGVLPDTNGRKNVVVRPCGTVSLIDTIPVGNEHPAVQELIVKQIESLDLALKEVA